MSKSLLRVGAYSGGGLFGCEGLLIFAKKKIDYLWFGHLPVEISCLLTYFLEASPENRLNAIVIGKRKREVGLVVPAKYAALTKNKTFANVLAGKLQGKKKKHPNFEFEITTATVTKVVTNVKYENMD